MQGRSAFSALGRLYLRPLPLKVAAALGLLGYGAALSLGADPADRARGPVLLALGVSLLLPLWVLRGALRQSRCWPASPSKLRCRRGPRRSARSGAR